MHYKGTKLLVLVGPIYIIICLWFLNENASLQVHVSLKEAQIAEKTNCRKLFKYVCQPVLLFLCDFRPCDQQ